jgi:hypothetical protein
LRSALGHARSDGILQAQAGGQAVMRVGQTDLPFTAAERAQVQQALTAGNFDSGHACAPSPTEIPESYGQTPLADLLDETSKQLAAGVKLGR